MSLLLLFRGSGAPASTALAMFVEMDFGAGYVDVTDDVVTEGFSLQYGIAGNGPLDRMASSGTLEFALRNDERNSASKVGYYSPQHVNVRPGFTFGIKVRVRFEFEGTSRTKFVGKLYDIDPEPGRYLGRRVFCTAYDYMYELAEHDLRSIGPQLNQTETQLMTAVLAALPVSVQPASTDFDSGLDTYPFAFDDIEGGVRAATALHKVVTSAWGRLFVKGNGTLTYLNRQDSISRTVDVALDNSMSGLSVPSSYTNVYDLIRVKSHPKTLSLTNTTVLASMPATSRPQFQAGESQTFWLEYRNPTDMNLKAGGTEFQPLTGTTDYTANTLPDGTGTNQTANITVTVSAFASTAKFVVTNNSAGVAYLTSLQLRGRGIYDIDPVTVESVGSPGTRQIDVDLPYQNDPNVAAGLADYIRNEYEVLNSQVNEVMFHAKTAELVRHALDREPGDLIVLAETVTGVNAGVLIHNVGLAVKAASGGGVRLECTWGLAPRVAGEQWFLDDAALSLLGSTTILGYA